MTPITEQTTEQTAGAEQKQAKLYEISSVLIDYPNTPNLGMFFSWNGEK